MGVSKVFAHYMEGKTMALAGLDINLRTCKILLGKYKKNGSV